MGKYTLALDIGTASIGWSVLDLETPGPMRKDGMPWCGVRIFPESVDPKKNVPNNEDRRKARGARRVIRRRRQRKYEVKQALANAGLYPRGFAERTALEDRFKDAKDEPYPGTKLYALRARALDETVSPHDLGRALLHLNQRRGFKSNRKSERGGKRDGVMAKSLDSLSAAIETANCRTIGEYLHRLSRGEIFDAQIPKKDSDNPTRLRNRYLLRSMTEHEFDELWTSQCGFHPTVLTSEAKEAVRLAIFYQRPLRSSKHLIGRCPCEPREPRCPRANWHAQTFRVLKDVNNLIIHNPDGTRQDLTAQQRQTVFVALQSSASVTFDEMREMLGLLRDQTFNLEEGPRARRATSSEKSKRKSLKGNVLEDALRKAFGKTWAETLEDTREELRSAVAEIEDRETFCEMFTTKWHLALDKATKLADLELPDGYMQYSLKAIRRINDHMLKGLDSSIGTTEFDALSACGYDRFTQTQDACELLPLPRTRDGRPLVSNPVVRKGLFEVRKVVNEIIRTFGKPTQIIVEIMRSAKQPLSKRKEIKEQQEANREENERIRRILRDDFDVGRPTRQDVLAYKLWHEQNFVSPYSVHAQSTSPYSGRVISQSDLRDFLHGHRNLEIDHILPYSKTIDDSPSNKCLCFSDENDLKGNQTPREWLKDGTAEYAAMLERVAAMSRSGMPFGKRRRFSTLHVELNDFITRQKNDTAYLAREVRKYLQSLFAGDAYQRAEAVTIARGQTTHDLRYHWDLNRFLSVADNDEKNRSDHRHHAIDAIVIGLTNDDVLRNLALTDRDLDDERRELPDPWHGFHTDVKIAIETMNVSHRVRRGIVGELHKDTPFGCTQKGGSAAGDRPWAREWIEQSDVYVRRKRLRDLDSLKQIAKIRDKTIRNIVRRHVLDRHPALGENSKFPKTVWAQFPEMPSGTPIRRVRMIESGTGYREVRPNAYVELSSNHHYVIYDVLDSRGQPIIDKKSGTAKRDGDLIPMLDVARQVVAAQREMKTVRQQIRTTESDPEEREKLLREANRRIAKDFPLVNKNLGAQKRFVMSLQINEMVFIEIDGKDVLHRVQKMTDGQIVFRPHYLSGKIEDTDKPPLIFRAGPSTFRGRKVVVDPLGRIWQPKG